MVEGGNNIPFEGHCANVVDNGDDEGDDDYFPNRMITVMVISIRSSSSPA